MKSTTTTMKRPPKMGRPFSNPWDSRQHLTLLRTALPSQVGILLPAPGSALLRRHPHAPKEPYGVKAVTTKNATVTTTAAATM